ncbi:SIR2 family protein [Undibacterium amnicola]|uniref:SIR2 family protein n=1 Tax=Undibacterium amnicola TaxID=1834038 RepID=A0ABR6XND3_9BURK|nr:SIR2 family protein [Undibacterium amnicola]MBC3830960.1 SIR2 family protein [Undibacterium amnicola]
MTESNEYRPAKIIQDAAKHGELVVFVGAGASKLCGSPDWRGFADQVVGRLEGAGALDFLEAEQLRGLGDSRRTLSIAMEIAKKKNIGVDFDSILHPSKPQDAGLELYKLLARLRPVFVTTNYDKWLDEASLENLSHEIKSGSEAEPANRPTPRSKYYMREQLSSALLAERGAVIHLHGSYLEPRSMVVSLKDYIEHYADEKVKEFLTTMFKNYIVLFVGYGLSELEILEYIIRSNEAPHAASAEPRHFLLYPHRSIELVQTGFIEQFFRDQCGVGVIKYCIDSKGYQEVVQVFKDWSLELDVRDPTILNLQRYLDEYSASPTPANQDAAFSLVSNRPELLSYFVSSLKGPVWFDALDRAEYFSVTYSPGVRTLNDGDGASYMSDGWPALQYIESNISLLNNEQAKRVVEIARAVTLDIEKRGLANWRTLWTLANILSELPLPLILESDIDLVKIWVSGRINSDMVGHELGTKLLPRLLDSQEQLDLEKALKLVDILTMLLPEGDLHD